MTAPGGVIATVYVRVLPEVKAFAQRLRQELRQSSRELRTLDREITPVTRAFALLGKTATGIVPGVRLTRQSLLALGAHAVVGGILSAAGAVTTLSGALGVIPALGVGAASVMGALGVGLFQVDDALKKFANEEKFNDKLELLSKNAQATLGVINEFRPALTDFRNSIQDQLFAGLDDVARSLVTTFLPRLEAHFGNIVTQINSSAKELAAFVQSGETLADVDAITQNVQLGFTNLRQALIPAATAFRDIISVGSRFLPEIGLEVANVVTRFSEWIQVMRATGQLDEFISNGIAALKQIFTIIGNVGRAFRALLTAAQESGHGLLDTLQNLTDKLADFLESARGQNMIKQFLDSASEAAKALAPVLVALADLLVNHILPIFEDFAVTLGPVVAEFFSELGNALDTAAPGISVFAAGFAAFVRAIIPVLPIIGQIVGEIGELVGVLAAKLGPVIAQVATAIGNVLIPILDVLTSIFIVISPEMLKFVIVIGVVVAAIAGLINVIRGFEAIGALFAGALAKMTTGMGKTQGAAQGLLGFLGGPWGIVIGAASIALGLFLSKTDDTQSSVNGLADAMANATGSTREATREFLRNKLETDGVAEVAAKAGVGINDLIDAYTGLPGAQESVIRQLGRAAEAGKISFEEFELLLGALNEGPGVYDRATAAAQRKKEVDEASAAPLQVLSGLYNNVTSAINQANEAVQKQNNLQLESLNSELAYQNQLARTQEELNEGTRTLDIYTQEGRDNLSSITELVRVGNAHIDDLRNQKASTQEITAAMQAQRDQILNMLQPFFSSRAAAEQYAIALGLIPKTITTTLQLSVTNAIAAAQAAVSRIKDIALGFIGGRAEGGPFKKGEWSWVGENGPELVQFGRSGRVYSNEESMRMSRDVGQLDSMTRGTTTATYGGSGGNSTWSGQPTQVSNQVTVNPTVKVYVDGTEFKGLVRVEMNERDRQLQRLVTANAGGRR